MMNDSAKTSAIDHDAADAFPEANVTRSWLSSLQESGGRWWLLTLVCLAAAIAVTWSSMSGGGTVISIRFDEGHGLKPRDTLRFRGIEAGEVTKIELSGDQAGVVVSVRLAPEAVGLAREGAEFWIDRPEVSLTRVRGLESVVGAKHLGVRPADDPQAPRKTQFVGLPAPPVVSDATGKEITVTFRDGYSLAAGDVVKHRGIAVGEAVSVELDDSLDQVKVRIRLRPSAANLARRGARFWIERPRVKLTGVTGLETVVRGVFVSVEQGPVDGELATDFQGLEEPPPVIDVRGGLEIILEAEYRHGLQKRSPVTYRGLEIGRILSVGLSADAAHIEARAYIQPEYRQLVRENSKFWSISGVEVRFGMAGLKLDYETLSTIAEGGVAMATPDASRPLVKTGKRFSLAKEADKEWLKFAPRIPVGSALLPQGRPLPQALRASLRWKQRRFGFANSRHRTSWVIPLTGNRLLGPIAMFAPEDPAIDGKFELEFEGGHISIDPSLANKSGRLATYQLERNTIETRRLWPTSEIRLLEKPEDCLVVPTAHATPIPLAAQGLSVEEDRFVVADTVPIQEDWHGAPVLSSSDGKMIGVLLVDDGAAVIEAGILGSLIAAEKK